MDRQYLVQISLPTYSINANSVGEAIYKARLNAMQDGWSEEQLDEMVFWVDGELY